MGTLTLEEQAAPSTPSANKVVLYPKSDGLLYSKDDAGTESSVTQPNASTTVRGVVELATQAELDAGTSDRVPTTDLNKLTLGTPVATTSGTAHPFTGIPAGTRRITITFLGVSLTSTDDVLVQIGDSGGIETTGYLAEGALTGASTGISTSTAGYIIRLQDASAAFYGSMILTLHSSSAFSWVASYAGRVSASFVGSGGGGKSLTAELTQLTITRTGASTFDAGAVNIVYER